MAVYTPLDYVIALALLFVLLWVLENYVFTKIELDRGFATALIPAVLLAIMVRLLADAGVYPKSDYWSVTPGIYLLGVAFGAASIAVGKFIEAKTKIEYWKTALAIGALTTPYFMLKLARKIAYPLRALYPLSLAVLVTSIVYVLLSLKKTKISSKENLAIIFAHLLDGSGTFIGMTYYGFSEEHILPELLIKFAGTAAVMIPLKLVVILGALYLVEKWEEESVYYKMIKFVFFILGFGPGVRNAMILTLA